MNRSITIAASTCAFLTGLALSQAACPPASPIIAPNDAADAVAAPDASLAACQTACNSLERIGCVTQIDCASVLCRSNADPRFPHFDLGCINKALVPKDVGVCGVSCTVRDP